MSALASRRTASILVVALSLLALVGVTLWLGRPDGSADPTPASAPISPGDERAGPSVAEPRPAAAALAEVQEQLSQMSRVRVVTRAPAHPASGRSVALARLDTGDFRVRSELGPDAERIEMIKIADMAWIKAPPAFWTRLGYTAASAARARGRYVVAPVESARAVVSPFDPTTMISQIRALGAADAVSLRKAGSGEAEARVELRVRFGSGAAALELGGSDGRQLIGMRVGSGKSRTVLEFSEPARAQISVPDADDVVTAREDRNEQGERP